MNTFIAKHYHIQADRPLIGLAPMRGYNDLPFRYICESMGADFSTIAINIDDFDSEPPKLDFTDKKPFVVQLLGSDIEKIAQTAKFYGENNVDIVDINLGRPERTDSKGGSVLLSDLDNVRKLLTAVVEACPVPVTLKTRLGIDADNFTALDVAEIANDIGIKLMTIHGRTKSEGFSGKAQFEEIAKIKTEYPKLAILANGDITTPDKAKQIIEYTACDGVLIGRGAIGEPWLFSALRATLDYDFVMPEINLSTVLLNHIKDIHACHSDDGRAIAKKHIGHYLMGFDLTEQLHFFTEKDSESEQIEKLSQIFPNVDSEDNENKNDEKDIDNKSDITETDATTLPPKKRVRTKAQIKEEIYIYYDEYNNISAKYSGAKLERRLKPITDEIEKCKKELRELSIFYKIFRFFSQKK